MAGMTTALLGSLRTLREAHPAADLLLGRPEEEQRKLGYYHTLHEILHQPLTWLGTCERVISAVPQLRQSLQGVVNVLFTGSGSSEYAGECVRMALQDDLGVVCTVVGGGTLLTCGRRAFPPARPALMVSLARSGESPESVGAVSLMLQQEPDLRHLVLTCNGNGSLAREFGGNPQVGIVTLDDATNDRSLVMTSSFTNLVLAARFLGMSEKPEAYRALCARLSQIAGSFFLQHFGTVAKLAALPFRRVVYLGSAYRYGAARESALKMLEITSGRVTTLSETYLGFRHGPMSFAHDDTLFVCFLSSDTTVRAYECDLLRELNAKKLGMLKVVVGEAVPSEIMNPGDVALECAGLKEVGDNNAVVIDAVAGQLLAFFRSLHEGLHPDSPSDGVITRVVQSFQLH